MVKTVLKIDGMMCGMCEAHINDAVRKKFNIKKVSSSHSEGKTEIVSEKALGMTELKSVIDETGYTLVSVSTEPCKKKIFGIF